MTVEEKATEYGAQLEKEGFDCFSCYDCPFSEETDFFKKGFRTGIPFFEFENQIRKAFIAGYKLGQGEEESRNKKTIADLLSQVTELRGIK